MYITYLLLGITILVSVRFMEDSVEKRRLMLNPYDVVNYQKWYRCFTHAFIHADWMHLIFNMYVLYMFGASITEHQFGYVSRLSLEPALIADFGAEGYLYFGCLYVGAILFTSTVSIFRHRENMHYNSLGASGAVMAVVFGYILLNPTAELGLIFLPIYVPAYIFGPIILIAEVLLSRRGGTGIAHDAHIAGAVFGIIFMTIVDYNYLLDFFKQFTS
jgi:membrane associated rhomboid family serine protease